jgi:tripartite-type tricarboxylate transporter receptor subunit TctC
MSLSHFSGRGFTAACLSVAAISVHAASSYPDHQIRLVVPFAPGQSADIIARVLAPKLGAALGQPIVVENRPGAGGSVGIAYVAHAAPDGYTIVMATIGPMSQQPWLNAHLPFSPTKDLAPISNIALTPTVLVANPATGFHTVADLIAKARQAPGTINYASSGLGSNQHITMELFKSRTGINVVHIPFKGGSESYTSILANQTPIMFDAIPAVLPHVVSGRLTGLAIASPTRSPFLPKVPTMAEAGVKDVDAVGWMGLAAPAGTPDAVLETLNNKVRKALDDSQVKAQMSTLAFTPAGGSRAEFAAYIASENAKWKAVIQQAGIKLE